MAEERAVSESPPAVGAYILKAGILRCIKGRMDLK